MIEKHTQANKQQQGMSPPMFALPSDPVSQFPTISGFSEQF